MIDLPGYPVNPEQLAYIDQRQAEMRERMRSVPEKGQVIPFRGREYVVLPGVFWPQVDDSGIGSCTPLLENYKINRGESVLDIGTGTGVIAIDAANRGASHVTGLDSNLQAAITAYRNAFNLAGRGFGLYSKLWVYQSDMFSILGTPAYPRAPKNPLGEVLALPTFDVITGNLPFRNKPAHDEVEASMWDTDFRVHRRFFAEAHKYLKPEGRIYLAQANFGGVEEALALAEQHGYASRLIGATHMPDNDPRVFYCFEMKRR